jgi:ATP phosphoribosyltransferase regulatory subunit
MAKDERWLLPDGIEEVLPDEARRLESLRRKILDLFNSWGYELVMPPMIEYLESLLTGVGRDMDLQTFKITDQLSGRMMGIRPDMTPQAARIDAHYLKQEGVTRLCYLGPVLLTRPDQFAGSREPLQVGAELFGSSQAQSDVETMSLMVSTLELLAIESVHIDLGHVGVFRGLASAAKLTSEQESALFDAMQRKAAPEIDNMLNDWQVSDPARSQLSALVTLNGDKNVLALAASTFSEAPATVKRALDELNAVAADFAERLPDVPLYFDLAELSGYGYYTGVVFSAFVPGHGRAVAKGGRYDGIGQAFGRSRPATGFGADLRELAKLSRITMSQASGIAAPSDNDASLLVEIKKLRGKGERVIVQSSSDQSDDGCDRELKQQKGKWAVVKKK